MGSIVGSTFVHEFGYRPFVSVDARGVETHGAAVTDARCWHSPSTKIIRDVRGQATAEQAVLKTEVPITVRDLVWLPGVAVPDDPADTTGSLKPLAVNTRYKPFSTAVDHYEVHL